MPDYFDKLSECIMKTINFYLGFKRANLKVLLEQ